MAQVLTKDQVEQDLVEHMENLLLDVDKVCAGCAAASMLLHGTTTKEVMRNVYANFIITIHTVKVRIGMIQHLHVVFSIMNAERRAEMLPLLFMVRMPQLIIILLRNEQLLIFFLWFVKVLESSNSFKNWRLRDAFASQLPRLVPLFPASTIFDMVVPPTFLLLDDPIFCVRSTACNAISPLHACE